MKTPERKTLITVACLIGLAFFAAVHVAICGDFETAATSLSVLGLGVMGMAIEATYKQEADTLDIRTVSATVGGEIHQLPDGRAGITARPLEAGELGGFKTSGLVKVPKTADIVFLDGGRVFWDHSVNKAHFKKANDRDFYLGTAVGDAAAADTEVVVNLNVHPWYVLDLVREAFVTATTGTAAAEGFGRPKRLGGTTKFLLTATSEVQKVDALSREGYLGRARAIIEGRFNPVANGSGAAVKFGIGVGDGTHATDSSTVARHVLLELTGGDTKIYAKSKDGTTTVAATDTTKTITEGTPVEFWLDCRDPANVKIYIDGVRVLAATTFRLDALTTQTLFLLVHLVKTTGTTTADFEVDWLRARIAE